MELNPEMDLSNTAYAKWKAAEQAAFDSCIPWKKAINNAVQQQLKQLKITPIGNMYE